ncbi:MAG: DUF502 domain-containing protein [Candidatus Omnitrophica bacterium]|nr:DUF502 domain-containing protein [Candidatus Omnitrophota bacterium]
MGKRRAHIFGALRNNFLAGITAILPIWVVYLVVKFILSLVNEALLNPTIQLLRPYLQGTDPRYITLSVKVVILVSILSLITLLGILVRNFFVSRVINFGERILMKVPFVNKIYVAIQQISRTFLIKKQSVFKRPVLVEYPRKGTYVLGIVTTEASGEIQEKTEKRLISVFIPTTPNPTSGFLLFVPEEDLCELDMSVEDVMKLIISGGAVTPPWKPLER